MNQAIIHTRPATPLFMERVRRYDGAHNALLDSLLGEVEAGRAGHAVLLLAGMLDANLGQARDAAANAWANEGAMAGWRNALRLHPIAQFLAPLSADAGDATRRRRILALLSDDILPPDSTIAVQRLHAAMAPIGFVRALKARLHLARQALTQAWQAGRSIAIIGDGQAELAALSGLDTANITLVPDCDAMPDRRFDLILAHHVPDDRAQRDMARAAARVAVHLELGGTLCLSGFVPAHLGMGWQAACLGRAPECHDEAGFAAVAAVAGLSLTHRRDVSNVLIWADLRAPHS